MEEATAEACSANRSGRRSGRPTPSRRAATAALRERWIEEALGYVPQVARRYLGTGLPLDELMAAGNLGLVEAALRFDPSRNVKFVTYADWWIRKTILKTVQDQSGPFRLPRYHLERVRVLRTLRSELRNSLGRDPGMEELAEVAGLPIREVGRLLNLCQPAVSLEHPAGVYGDLTVGDNLARPADPEHPEALIDSDYREHLRSKLASLENREGIVLSLRFGLLGARPMTLRQVGRRLRLSRERVRQIEHGALRKLRNLL